LLAEVKNRADLATLYRSLHYVGDDPVKASIEETLEELLDGDTLKTIKAVFQIHTDEALMLELERKGFWDED